VININKVIEENIIEYYSDFQSLSDLQDDYTGYINLPDRNSDICKDIYSIIKRDLMAQCKTDIMHYILEDVCNLIDWDYITGELQNYYFAEPSHD
jgi:hypothetical protein